MTRYRSLLPLALLAACASSPEAPYARPWPPSQQQDAQRAPARPPLLNDLGTFNSYNVREVLHYRRLFGLDTRDIEQYFERHSDLIAEPPGPHSR